MKRITGIVLLAMTAMAPLAAYPWDAVVGGAKGDAAKVVSRSEADAAVYQAAQKVNEARKVSDETAQELNATLKSYSDTNAWHPGIGIGGSVSLGGEYGADLLMSLRYKDVMTIFSVGYGDMAHIGEFDQDKLKLGIGTIIEF